MEWARYPGIFGQGTTACQLVLFTKIFAPKWKNGNYTFEVCHF